MKGIILVFGVVIVCWKTISPRNVKVLSQTPPKDTVSIIFGGDVDFSRIIKYNHGRRHCTYANTLKRLNNYFQSADFSIVNLETTVKEHRKKNPMTHTVFYSEESVLPALKNAGVTCVTVANNHISDFREAGTNKTIELLEKYGIKHVGVIYGKDHYAKQKPLILEKNGVKIGVLNYCDLWYCERNWKTVTAGPAMVKVSSVISEVRSLREKNGCDIVILFMHWGVQYSSIIALNEVALIRDLLKAVKIDVIVGAHPHVTQKHWYVSNTLVAPSLGNLIFAPHGLANYNFNKVVRHRSTDEFYERLWYKQMQVMRDATMIGRLMKVTFNRDGVVKEKSQYLRTKVGVTKRQCVVVNKDKGARWQTVCDDDDEECTGTPECNYIQCDGEETYPASFPSEFPKWRVP